MKRILIIILLLLVSQVVPGQTEEEEETQGQQEQKDQVDADKTEQSPAADVSDTFTPSEEISEDLSVSFPVDI